MTRTLITLSDAFKAIKEIQDRITYYDTMNQDFNKRQIKNAHPSIDDYDYVVRKELKPFTGNIIGTISSVGGSVGNNIFTVRAILPGAQAITTDITANRYRLTLPDDSKKIRWVRCSATAKIGPVSGNWVANILLSTDESVTFNTIFGGSKPTIVSGQSEGEEDAFDIPEMSNNNELRVDVTSAGGASGVELVLLGLLVAA